MTNVYGVLLIGLGNIAMGYDLDRDDVTWTHMRAINRRKNFKVIAAIDTCVDTHDRFRKLTSAKVYRRIDDFLEDEHEPVDMVVISSPTIFHLEHYKKIKSLMPKLVLMEKPLVATGNELNLLMTEISSGPKVMVNLFRLYQGRLNEQLQNLASLGKCRIQVNYSQTMIHNGIHFMSLIMRHFGKLLNQKSFMLQGVKVNQYEFQLAQVIFQPSMANLDDNSMVVKSGQGTFYYLNGGRLFFFVDALHNKIEFNDHEFKHHMLNVYDQCLGVINGRNDDSLHLAYACHKILTEPETHVA